MTEQTSESIRLPGPSNSHDEKANLSEIPLIVNGLLSDDPLLRAHSTEHLMSIALLDEEHGSASSQLYFGPLIIMLESSNEEKSQTAFDALNKIIKKSVLLQESFLRCGFLEISRYNLIDENAPEHVHSNTLSIITELITNGVNPNEMAQLIPILTKLGSEKDQKKKKISLKAKMIETLLASQGVTCPLSSDEIQELKRQNEEQKRQNEELKRQNDELKRQNEEQKRQNEKKTRIIQDKERIIQDKDKEIEQLKRDNEETIYFKIPMSVLIKIGEDFKIPLEGTEVQKRNILETQEKDAQLLIRTYEGIQDEIGRRRVIQAGIVEGFLYIFENRELNTIPITISYAFYQLTNPASDEIKLLLFQKNPFPGLLRLFDHTDIDVLGDAISAINNILLAGVNITPMNQPHPHFESINTLGGVEKIFSLFRRNVSKHSKNSAAICIGQLFRAKEIVDADMLREIIAHLKMLTNDPDDWVKTNSKFALIDLARNEVNRADIESGGFVIPE
ncbi:MAG: hypothetical protein EZS28_015950 [Streblomastix strix]|uniref:Uncharacterized protein n=1 Tax=Streblomastix strix TaxID=222440 RepID=A0A5J4W151_9EUKA|nr:MAG: hypothetical protein EZS28_015950 [Streblomastix strix]